MFSVGQNGEKTAQKEYKKRGFKIIRTNEFNRFGKQAGEIDFIALSETSIRFVEVKTRTHESRFGSAAEAVNYSKIRKLITAVKLFLHSNPKYKELTPAIDVCTVEFDKTAVSVKIIESPIEDYS